ncbi:right-handed parallel beta-helix repeat-containing protein [soil metagenome]
MKLTPLVFFFVACVPLYAYELKVSPDGPLKTLEAARDNVRAWREGAGKGLHEAVRVIVEGDRYEITQPIVFEPRDGGTAAAPVSYEAAPDAHPVISGGKLIKGWKNEGNGLWTADIPEVKDGKWYFQDLWINGQRATRAKTPNTHYYHAERPAQENREGAPAMAKPDFTAFYARAEDLTPLSKLDKQALADVEVTVFQTWQIARHRIDYLDAKSGYLQFTAPSRWPFVVYESRQRYLLENYKEALDEPGEWFLSREGKIYYIARPGEDLNTAEVIAPVAEALLSLNGEADQGKRIEYLNFKGLTFAHSRYQLSENGHIDSQADSQIPAAVMVQGAKSVTFENCEIAHTAIYGIWFTKGSRECVFQKGHLHDLGAGGIRIGEMRVDSNPAMRTHHITVDNNIIQNGGRYFMGSVGVLIGHSGENDITHNDIGDFYYSGISAGWVWGYGESLCHHNHIDFNHIHHLGYGVLSDMGGVYLLGPSAGTTVSNNHVHDVSGYRYGGWGLYTDEGSSGILMENNLVHDTRHATFHQHYGKDNIIRNNIFALGDEAQIQRSRDEDHFSFAYQNNIVYYRSGVLFYGQWSKPKVRMEQNLYWDAAERPLEFSGGSLEEWQKRGYDRGSRIADPLFVNVEDRNFHLKPESPALQMDFKPFDYEKAGVYGEDSWKKLAASRVYPVIAIEPLPTFAFSDDFEKTPIGKSIYLGRAESEGKGDSILVSDEQAKSGHRSLKFTDVEGLTHRYAPHLSMDVGHKDGITGVSFDVWLEPDAEFYHEWRDKQAPYNGGPLLEIRKGQLKAGGQSLGMVPARDWVHVEIECALGEQWTGKWSLVVTLPDGTRLDHRELPLKKPAWKTLDWLVLTSDANTQTAFYLDNLEIKKK